MLGARRPDLECALTVWVVEDAAFALGRRPHTADPEAQPPYRLFHAPHVAYCAPSLKPFGARKSLMAKPRRSPDAPKPKSGRRTKRGGGFGRSLLRVSLGLAVSLSLLSGAALVGGYWFFASDLPDFGGLSDWNPPQVSRLYATDGTPIAELFEERRTLVPRERIPEVLVQAVLSAEDGDFYRHEGLDYFGMLNALVNSLKAGHLTGSGSTITQQVVKNLVLSPERTFERKAKEIILSRRIEAALTKDEILWLYLNAVYFGHGRYGVQEAARFYFAKEVDGLGVVEAAALAGLIQSPERLSPRKHPERNHERRRFVIREMVDNGFLSPEAGEAAQAVSLKLPPPPIEQVADAGYYVEEVRRRLLTVIPEEELLRGGLRVETALDLPRQRGANDAVGAALRAIDTRQGYAVKVKKVDDLAAWRKRRAEKLEGRPPLPGLTVPACVSKVTETEVVLDLGVGTATIPMASLERLRPIPVDDLETREKKKSEKAAVVSKWPPFEVGTLLDVTLRADGPRHPASMLAGLALLPQAAFVALDPRTREVVALIGGSSFAHAPFNRATQARRQPGSTFKPFVYGAALASRRYTPATIMIDAPETFPLTGSKWWRPENYSGKFLGPLPLRRALAQSINTVAIKLIADVGPKAVEDFARAAGIEAPLADNLTLALGSSEVTPVELANAYSTVAANGKYARPIFIRRVLRPDGSERPFSEHPDDDAPGRGLEPDVTFVLRHLMRSVVTEGTATALATFPRLLVGKTGTTNDARDAWFVGLLPSQVMVAWLGFDDNRPLGRKETGGQAAIPIVRDYAVAFESEGPDWPALPTSVVVVRIDPVTGLRVSAEGSGGREEVFLAGTEPTQETAPVGELGAANLFFDDTPPAEAGPGSLDPAPTTPLLVFPGSAAASETPRAPPSVAPPSVDPSLDDEDRPE